MPPCSEKQEMLFIAQASQSLACIECGKNEHPQCFCISQGMRSLFPTAAASSAPFWLEPRRWGGVGVEKQMEKTVRKRTLLILVLKQIQETCEGPAHQEERFPPTLLHTGQLSECRA